MKRVNRFVSVNMHLYTVRDDREYSKAHADSMTPGLSQTVDVSSQI